MILFEPKIIEKQRTKVSELVFKKVSALESFPRVHVKVGDVGLVVKDCLTDHYEVRFGNCEIVLERNQFEVSNE